jgi:hypothetical protein
MAYSLTAYFTAWCFLYEWHVEASVTFNGTIKAKETNSKLTLAVLSDVGRMEMEKARRPFYTLVRERRPS